MDFQDLLDAATTIGNETAAAVDAVTRNEHLAQETRAEQIEAIKDAGRKQVADLQETARQRMRGEVGRIRRESKTLWSALRCGADADVVQVRAENARDETLRKWRQFAEVGHRLAALEAAMSAPTHEQ